MSHILVKYLYLLFKLLNYSDNKRAYSETTIVLYFSRVMWGRARVVLCGVGSGSCYVGYGEGRVMWVGSGPSRVIIAF